MVNRQMELFRWPTQVLKSPRYIDLQLVRNRVNLELALLAPAMVDCAVHVVKESHGTAHRDSPIRQCSASYLDKTGYKHQKRQSILVPTLRLITYLFMTNAVTSVKNKAERLQSEGPHDHTS